MATIEQEILGDCEPAQRYDRLLTHCGELADRWIGLTNLESVSAKALINNDGFRALRICLTMILDSVPARTRPEYLDHFRELFTRIEELRSDPNSDVIKAFVGTLRNTFRLPR